MKKIILSLLAFLFFVVTVNAQVGKISIEETMQLVSKNNTAIGLSNDELNNVVVSSAYYDKSTGQNMVYLQQTFKTIPVYNQMLVLAFKNGALLSKAGIFNHSIEKMVNVQSAIPAINAEAAVVAALADRKLVATKPAIVVSAKENGQKIEFGNMGISRENITAQLMWVPSLDEKLVTLAWQVYIIPTTTSDYWQVRIDASNSKFIGVNNLTVYCNWGNNDHKKEFGENHTHIPEVPNATFDVNNIFNLSATENKVDNNSSPSIVNSSSYRVVPYPAESPQAVGGAHAIRTDPWLLAPGNATTLKWHTGIGGVDYDYTRGNNVWAYQDRVAPINSGTVAKSTTSTTALPSLTFDFTPNYTVDPLQTAPVPNVQFNTTNVFYWNNVIHDVLYQYGFDEAGGNFQDDNLGRGGAGNDHVNAEAQDGGGLNNANFSTPVDGGSGRMQMFLWDFNGSNPLKDGDVDNGIIVHEFGHGLSNRLTGGPANSSCLGNAEQMGEGWSDYYSLMFTTNWATAALTDGFTIRRPIGLYALNNGNLFGTSAPNTGIRRFAYSTNMAVNPSVYSASLPSVPHDRGEIWCATLWDMTWAIINQVGSINPNIYNATGVGGNTVAMRLVTEGMKLQQCSPGFISGRNAILQADLNLYGGTYRCAIIAAFARRGMGTNASEGSTSSVTDQVVDFTGGGPSITLTQNGITAVPEGQNIIYNNKVVAECAAINNFILRDTLPLNVTFVSATNGGTYNSANRVVSWPISLAANAIGNYGFTVNINAGSYFAPVVLINETVPSTTIAPFWTPSSTTASVWTAHNVRSKSAPNSFFTPNTAVVSDQIIATTASFATGITPPTLSFWHWYNSEDTYDGAALEISTNGGGTWGDIGIANFTQNGYNGVIDAGFSNPLAGRQAWSGNSNAFIETKVNLNAYANQANVKLRWRFGSDNVVAATGWNVDDITLQRVAVVNMRTSLFNASNIRVGISDTVTVILPPINVNPSVTINQAVGQADPTTASPINFTAVFSEGVNGFTNSDVVLSGTAAATTAVVTGGPITYNVAVSGMSLAGTVIASIPAAIATGVTSALPNLASTSTDNVVNYNIPGPCVLTCPANIVVNATTGLCGAVVNFAVTSTGTCGTITSTPASGTVFPVGTTTVTTTTTSGATCTFTVKVNDTQAPVITCPANINVCLSQVVTFALPTATDNCSATVTQTAGLASGAVYPLGTTTNTFVAIDPAGNSSTCSFNVLVSPTVTATATPASQTICNTAAINTIVLTSNIGSTTYSWTRNNTATVTGIAANGTGNIAGSLVNTTNAPITVTFTIIPTAGCVGAAITASVIVNPAINLSAISNQVVCNTAATAAVNFANNTTGGTVVYNWTNNTTSIGLAATGAGNIASFNAINTGNIPVVATITVTPSFTNAGITCTGAAATFTITVNPTATVNAIANQVLCNATATTAITFASPSTGGTIVYNWTNSATSIGLAASGAGNIASFTATNITNAPITATITVTPSYTNAATTCIGISKTFTITVNPTPIVNTIASQAVCNNLPTAAINFTGFALGTAYAWTNNTASIGLAAAGNGNIASFVATNTSSVPVVATITVTPSANGCTGVPINFTITVNPTPTVTLTVFTDICKNATPLTLSGGSPVATAGTTGIYFVNGVAQTVFNPLLYNVGLHTIVYQYTNATGCVSSATKTILLTAIHTVEITVAPALVRPDMPVTVIATVSPVNNYTYVWKKDNALLPAQSADRVVVLANAAGNYSVAVTSPTGCTVVSNNAFTNAAVLENILFVYPNPSNGVFYVSYNNGAANLVGRTLNVYDNKGARILSQTYSVLVPFGNMKIDISQHAKGLYQVALIDNNGKELGTTTILKQ
jgi:hypothetical protein